MLYNELLPFSDEFYYKMLKVASIYDGHYFVRATIKDAGSLPSVSKTVHILSDELGLYIMNKFPCKETKIGGVTYPSPFDAAFYLKDISDLIIQERNNKLDKI